MKISIPRAIQDYLYKIGKTEYFLLSNQGMFKNYTFIYKKYKFWFSKKIGTVYENGEVHSSDKNLLDLLDACTDYKTKFKTQLIL